MASVFDGGQSMPREHAREVAAAHPLGDSESSATSAKGPQHFAPTHPTLPYGGRCIVLKKTNDHVNLLFMTILCVLGLNGEDLPG